MGLKYDIQDYGKKYMDPIDVTSELDGKFASVKIAKKFIYIKLT